ncbi:MAG: quinol:cytochrome C oxidoreductase [Mucilaginibacter sp.]|uniref:quinol:cytochrome C oxidoreductase n=1 Tax=Mucilaginibacter sp. L3T2-6 TaxID=3062491 RepID=UPI0026756CF0|nr:quinol:cytochrome C oxidoreductase [Mucilaginibacter sp. L3T2-6]MDO3640496.1 quinol:cytochrome C oxidoreductase [Mucilaginibacter sp. L3T2-6]MDV6213165.1 quinol:cytochrome C oxidoreductase [Mucilaginibacter sp. L3T2-6]
MNTSHSFDEQFEFKGRAKSWSLIMIVIGVIGLLAAFFTNGERAFANLLLNGYYMSCVCICGIFFCAVQYVAQAGWSASVLRVPQALAKVLPVAGVILLLVIGAGLFVTHPGLNEEGKSTAIPYLYKLWALKGVTDSHSENYDAIITAKSGYLNIPFFLIRLVIYLGSYTLLGRMLVKYSNNEDELGGMFNYKKSFKVSVLFLVIFGFTVPLFAFDTIMSLEAHWFSTMFGWYNFAALWVSGLSVITLAIILLRKAGYMQWVTEDHLHNLGQLMFGFSIFWTYLWFGQFLLTWYANIPEEAAYFYRRWEPQFKPWFWLNIIVNFLTPLLVLMSRDSKRKTELLKVACIILICGHWLDYWQMIMPGTIGVKGVGEWYSPMILVDFAIFVGAAGFMVWMFGSALSKFKSLVPKKHPLLQESLHHHI